MNDPVKMHGVTIDTTSPIISHMHVTSWVDSLDAALAFIAQVVEHYKWEMPTIEIAPHKLMRMGGLLGFMPSDADAEPVIRFCITIGGDNVESGVGTDEQAHEG